VKTDKDDMGVLELEHRVLTASGLVPPGDLGCGSDDSEADSFGGATLVSSGSGSDSDDEGGGMAVRMSAQARAAWWQLRRAQRQVEALRPRRAAEQRIEAEDLREQQNVAQQFATYRLELAATRTEAAAHEAAELAAKEAEEQAAQEAAVAAAQAAAEKEASDEAAQAAAEAVAAEAAAAEQAAREAALAVEKEADGPPTKRRRASGGRGRGGAGRARGRGGRGLGARPPPPAAVASGGRTTGRGKAKAPPEALPKGPKKKRLDPVLTALVLTIPKPSAQTFNVTVRNTSAELRVLPLLVSQFEKARQTMDDITFGWMLPVYASHTIYVSDEVGFEQERGYLGTGARHSKRNLVLSCWAKNGYPRGPNAGGTRPCGSPAGLQTTGTGG
jgi:hypothetical protein